MMGKDVECRVFSARGSLPVLANGPRESAGMLFGSSNLLMFRGVLKSDQTAFPRSAEMEGIHWGMERAFILICFCWAPVR